MLTTFIITATGVCGGAGRERPHATDERTGLLGERGGEFTATNSRRTHHGTRRRPRRQWQWQQRKRQDDLPFESRQSSVVV